MARAFLLLLAVLVASSTTFDLFEDGTIDIIVDDAIDIVDDAIHIVDDILYIPGVVIDQEPPVDFGPSATFGLLLQGEPVYRYGDISFPEKKWAKPGDDVDLRCSSDNGYEGVFVYPPNVPDEEEVAAGASEAGKTGKPMTVINSLYGVQKGVDDGFYYCIIYHGVGADMAPYSIAKMELIIGDLCEGQCNGEHDIGCKADYDKGTFECEEELCYEGRCGKNERCEEDGDTYVCTCDLQCENRPDATAYVCSDTCEFFFNECNMREQSCKDGIDREVDPDVINPILVCLQPTYADVRIAEEIQEVSGDYGETIQLSAGVLNIGSPAAKIRWVERAGFGAVGEYLESDSLILDYTITGRVFVTATVTQCKQVWSNVYEVIPEIDPTPTPLPTTPLAPTLDPFIGHRYRSCSILPGGIIDNVYSQANRFDLACTHVLAASVASDVAWFVYGTFDIIDGDIGLSAMTMYLGSTIFEFQRGWVLNIGGEKVQVREGETRAEVFGNLAADEVCYISYLNNHLSAICEGKFEVYFDGLMAGHVRLLPPIEDSGVLFEPKVGEFGLCWDFASGWRPNWQVGQMAGSCEVEQVGPIQSCEDNGDCDYPKISPSLVQLITLKMGLPSFLDCGVGSTLACTELSCGAEEMTPEQACSIEQAYNLGCELKHLGVEHISYDYESFDSCPDLCEWRESVVASGCPQEVLPYFECSVMQ